MIVAVDEVPFRSGRTVRFYDLASTKPKPARRNPDWTAGVLACHADDDYWIVDVVRLRDRPAAVETVIWQTWLKDAVIAGEPVPIRVELEGGSGGGFTVHGLKRAMRERWTKAQRADFVDEQTGLPVPDTPPDLAGYPTGNLPKPARARLVALAAAGGHVHVVDGPWLEAFLDEHELFMLDSTAHDDQVDACSGAFRFLTRRTDAAGIAVDRSEPAAAPTGPDAPTTTTSVTGRAPARPRRQKGERVTFTVR